MIILTENVPKTRERMYFWHRVVVFGGFVFGPVPISSITQPVETVAVKAG